MICMRAKLSLLTRSECTSHQKGGEYSCLYGIILQFFVKCYPSFRCPRFALDMVYEREREREERREREREREGER